MNQINIRRFDRSDFRKFLIGFPGQIKDAVRLAKRFRPKTDIKKVDGIVFSGLGGSAIGGDLLRSYLTYELKIPFTVNRHYKLPDFVNERTLVIVSSYSGNTEETVAAHTEARKRKAQIICLSSNGETARLANKYGQPLLTFPGGYPPRAALGYSFFSLLVVLGQMKLIGSKENEIRETVSLLGKKSKLYGALKRDNPALRIAQQLFMKLPVIYSSADNFDVVNLRWRGQIAENAKQLAFGHVLPEMNHNELVGWRVLRRMMEEEMVAVFLRDRSDHERVSLRMDITRDILEKSASRVIEVRSEGKSLLARMFSVIYLGDWMSFYLSILNGVDPTPVSVIDYLKNKLARK